MKQIIKKTTLFLLAVVALTTLALAQDHVNPDLEKKAEVVLRVKRLSFEGADKYAWYTVAVLKVIKNTSNETFGGKLKIAAYSWKHGVPVGESVVYLERYNESNKRYWRLLGGETATGVSQGKISTVDTLKKTLESLNLGNPMKDAEQRIASKDMRLVGIYGYTCYAPGVEKDDLALAQKYGVRCLDGTSDSIESAEHERLIKTSIRYAERYNHFILKKLRSIDEPNQNAREGR